MRRLRGIANISQLALAESTGLAHNFINDIENGKKWASAETIGKLAYALKAEPYQLFISESKRIDLGAGIFSLYLDDFSHSTDKVADDYRFRYLTEDSSVKLGAVE